MPTSTPQRRRSKAWPQKSEIHAKSSREVVTSSPRHLPCASLWSWSTFTFANFTWENRIFPAIVKCQHLQSLKNSEEFKVNFHHLMTTLFISISSSEFWHRWSLGPSDSNMTWEICWCRVSCPGHFGSAATSAAVVMLAQSPHQRPGVGKMLSAIAQINHKPRVWASGSHYNPQLFSVDWYVYCQLSQLVPMTSFRHLTFNCTASQSGLAVTPAPKINSHEAM